MPFQPSRSLVIGLAVTLVAAAPLSAANTPMTVAPGYDVASVSMRQPMTRYHRRGTPSTCSGIGAGSFIGANNSNVAAGNYSGIVSGQNNLACGGWSGVMVGFGNETDGESDFIGGGYLNVDGGSFDNVIAGGEDNNNGGINSLIGGGSFNKLTSLCTPSSGGCSSSGGDGTAIVAGFNNSINGAKLNTGNGSIIGAGKANGMTGQWSAIVSGSNNDVTADDGFIGGGSGNLVSAKNATIPGGLNNIASGVGSFAAGSGAEALGDGSFVWSDSTKSPVVKSTAKNQFLARASGGVIFYSDIAESTGVKLAQGSGSWSNLSDRAVKSEIVPVDGSTVLAKVAALPVSEWSYTAQGTGIRHIGPMAQDFYAAFQVGEDNRHITTIDEGGVALAAIKGLHAENERLRARLVDQGAQIAALQSELAHLAAKVDAHH
jgi:hypothetical protein